MPNTDTELLIGMVRDLGGKLDSAISKQYEQHTEVMSEVATLNTHMTSLIGNGQPGRITKVEDKIDSLMRFRWKMAGLASIGSVILFAIESGISYLIHKH